MIATTHNSTSPAQENYRDSLDLFGAAVASHRIVDRRLSGSVFRRQGARQWQQFAREAARRSAFALSLLALVGGSIAPHAARASAADVQPAAVIDLTSDAGASLVSGIWRYSDARIVDTAFRAPDATGQPTGAPVSTYDIAPQAGSVNFDDSTWPVVAPPSLDQRRGNGRVSFNWYRIKVTVPAHIGAFDPTGSTVWFETRLDDYAEVWIDGEIGRAYGQVGGSVVGGWNASNRLIAARNVKPGQTLQIAVFGMNGPISNAPTNYIYVREAKLEFVPGVPGPVAVTPHEVNVQVTRLDPAIDTIVPPNAKLFKLAEGFEFTEGPVWVRDGGYLLFSDPNHNTIYSYSENGSLTVFRDKSGYDAADIAEYGQPGSNGLTLDRQGRLTIDEHGRHRITRIERDGHVTVLADRYQGKRLNSPNDLVYRSDGSLYFTDPPFGLPKFYDDPRKELPWSGVFRWHDGRLQVISKDLKGPNGIAFSPDENYLYVGNWDPAAKTVTRFKVRRDGSVGAGETFIDLTREIPGEEALDGIKIDTQGNLYLSAPGGVWIFNSAGKHLGTIKAPKPVHNFAWGGADGRTLYLCARSALYRIPLLAQGVRP
jgi:gluconolactonase